MRVPGRQGTQSGLDLLGRLPQSVHMPQTVQAAPPVLSVDEAATILAESRWTVQRRARRGELGAIKVGHAYVLDRQAVLDLAAALEHAARAEVEARSAARAGIDA